MHQHLSSKDKEISNSWREKRAKRLATKLFYLGGARGNDKMLIMGICNDFEFEFSALATDWLTDHNARDHRMLSYPGPGGKVFGRSYGNFAWTIFRSALI